MTGRSGSRAPGLRGNSPNGLECEDAMPNYDYKCEECGPFTAMQPMARFRDPCVCPECGAEAPRTLLSAPAIISGNPSGRFAYEATQRSATSLRHSSAVHPAGCGCCV